MGKVFDQKETYDWAVSGPVCLVGAPAALAAAPLAAAVAADEEAPLATLGDACEAACDNMAALLTICEAAERALAKLGREPELIGPMMAASGEEAAAETTLEASPAGWAPTGLVCT